MKVPPAAPFLGPRSRRAAALAGLVALLASAVTTADPGSVVPAGRPRVCLVLSGGGARGAAHIGVLRVLEELRVPVDCIVGTSMGSIVGGAYAAGVSPDNLEKQVRDTQWDRVLSDQPGRVNRSVRAKELERKQILGPELGLDSRGLVLPRGAIIGQALEIFLQELVGRTADLRSFDDLPIPFRAIATDIETGDVVVLDRGSLAAALRASMSVPGVFAPQELDGRLLADGGLVRNLGVDVARRMGADVVIAVNLGTPLLKRSELGSLLGVSAQTINILTEQNVQRSLKEITDRDVLILPELGDFSSSDFEKAYTIIATGDAAARVQATRLSALSLPADQYAQYRASLVKPEERGTFDVVKVETKGLDKVNPASVTLAYQDAAGQSAERETILTGVTALYATDDFQQIRLRVEDELGSRALVIEPTEKGWGPNYVKLGVGLSTDFSGNSNFTIAVDDRWTWLNRRALEWRNSLALGERTGIVSELYQPLDLDRRWFVAPTGSWQQRVQYVYFDTEAVAQYRDKQAGAGFDVGYRFGTAGELRLGLDYSLRRSNLYTGIPVFPDIRQESLGWRGRLVVDKLDDWLFPKSGYYLNVDARMHRNGIDDHLYDLMYSEFRVAMGGGRNSLWLGAANGTSFGTQVPFYDAFALGGPVLLPGYRERELLVDGYTLVSATYQYRLVSQQLLGRGLIAGATVQLADIRHRLNGPEPGQVALGSTVFITAGTPLGPAYLGVAVNDLGETLFYLYVGRPY